jgi:hypothetical protein
MASRWFYCERNNVRLPDEYDRIYNDLEPFWGMDPIDLQRLQLEAGHETYGDSFTLGKAEGSEITLIASALPENDPEFPTKFHLGKAKQIMDVLNKFSEFIPSFKAVFSPHDNPNMSTDWELKTQALEAAANETCMRYSAPQGLHSDADVSMQLSMSTIRLRSKILAGHPLALLNRVSAILPLISTSLPPLPPKRHSSTTT